MEVTKKEIEEYIQMIDSLVKTQSVDYVYWMRFKEKLIKMQEDMDG